ncbi:hypothetical protein Tco_1272667 [Tanacetum coccineum]
MRMTTGESIALEIQFDLTVELLQRVKLGSWNFVENLCNKLRTCANGIRKYLTFVKIEVFPFIVMNCSREMQRWLLYASLEMMPFGLLKCTVRIGYSYKTAVEKFRLELHAAFENRCSFLSEQIKKGASTSSSAFNSSSMYDTSYSSGINFHVLFPQRLDMSTHLSTYPTENNTESRPVDHIIFFHKALKKDIEQAVSISANLAITKSSENFRGDLWAWPRRHLVNPTRGPAVLNFKTNLKETNPLLTTSKTYEFCNTSENNPYNYQLRVALNCFTEMH